MLSDLEKLLAKIVQRTAQLLQSAQVELAQISWQDGETNTDSGYSKLARLKFRQAFGELFQECSSIQLIDLKEPDISYTISSGASSLSGKIELKSCKSNSSKPPIIPGSTIANLDWNMWVIFCKRTPDNSVFDFRYGRYFLGIDTKPTELFQDRTPRPRISWNGYQPINEPPKVDDLANSTDWIKKYAQAAVNRISGEYGDVDHSWQDELVKEIIKIAREKGITGK